MSGGAAITRCDIAKHQPAAADCAFMTVEASVSSVAVMFSGVESHKWYV